MSEAISKSNFYGPVPYTKITSERYISTEYMLKERDNIWSKTWLVAGPAQDVEQPGDFFVFELESRADESEKLLINYNKNLKDFEIET